MTQQAPTIDPRTLARLAQEAGLQGAAISIFPITGTDAPSGSGLDAWIYPASMIKTPLAVAVAIAERDQRLAWTETVEIGAANMTPNDAPSPLIAGRRASIAELVELMLSRSDNVATNVLIDRVGRRRASADLAALGFPGTVIRRKLSGALPLIDDPEASGRNAHGARDAAELFARIARDEVPRAGSIARALAAQFWNTKLTAGLESADHFAHKTGDTDEVSHDGGIMTFASGSCYAIAVYTELPSNAQTDRCFGAFMRAIRPLLAGGG